MPKLKRTATAPGDGRPDSDFIESLDRGLRVFELFGADARAMTLSAVAQAANLPRATARRILFTLERAGYVESDGKMFKLTPRVLVLAAGYLSSSQMVSILQPVLDRLSSEAHEISSLAILDGHEAIFVARASPARVFSAGIDIGYRLPAFCTSVGRVLLGRLPDKDLAQALDAIPLLPITPHTETSKPAIHAAILAGRDAGYCLVDREAEPDFRSISVPVCRYDGTIVAALNIGGHVDRLSTDDMINRLLPLLRDAAASVKSMIL